MKTILIGWSTSDEKFSCNNLNEDEEKMLEKKQNKKQKRVCDSFLKKLTKKTCPSKCTPGMLTSNLSSNL